MKSNKQRRAEIKARRLLRAERTAAVATGRDVPNALAGFEAVNASALAPNNSYGVADFVFRGYYLPVCFRCRDCGGNEVWTAKRQKWWYETMQGDQYSTAVRCRACRAVERDRKALARLRSQLGLELKMTNKKLSKEHANIY